MAGGPIAPLSTIPVTADRVFATQIDGDDMLGVEASVGADSTWRLRFPMPPSLPTGTAKLHLRAKANATSGDAKVNPKWASVAAEESPGGASLNAEGTTTITWAAGDANVYKEAKITLDADTVVANEMIAMDLVFETTNWTLAAQSGWYALVIWE